jgi:thiamine transport system substrate-binding protein
MERKMLNKNISCSNWRPDQLFCRLFVALLALFLSGPVLAEKPVLTIYTYESFVSEWGPGPKVEAAFEAECGCDLQFVALDSSLGILGRIRIEGAASPADLVLGLDTNVTEIARQTGLFAPHQLTSQADALPGQFTDPDFLAFDWGVFAFVYDRDRLASPPDSMEALRRAPDSLKIVIQDPRTATPGLGLLLWAKSVYGDEAGDFWRDLQPKIVTVTKGWWDAYSLFLEGNADMVLSYATSPAYHSIAEGKDNYAAAEFAEGHYLQIEVAGMLKNAPQPELARAFLRFMQGPVFQQIIPTTNWMYPVRRDSQPDGFDGLVMPQKTWLFPAEKVAAEQKNWIAEWLAASR